MVSKTVSEKNATPPIGDLVLQNGRQAGMRRALSVPATFIGRGPGSDIRLNIDGVDATHCVLVLGPDGLVVRDLNSEQGTFVNAERVDTAPIRNGDMLKVGPFQFRVELSTVALIELQARSAESASVVTEAAQIQVAAVVAQQIALEEDEARLLQRQSDMQQQEDQLAEHLAEKQRQVQMWSEHTKAERVALRQQKTEQNQILSQWERELKDVKQHLGDEQERVNHERDRINKIYQRLRQRWHKQWSTQKDKYETLTAKLHADAQALAQRQQEVSQREAHLAEEVMRVKTEHEAGARQLQEGWEELKKAQQTWRRRHAQERTLWKEREEEVADAVARMHQARQALQQEREAWKKQQDAMQKELHGLNNRVVHQREKMKEQEGRINALDAELRTRLLHLRRVADIESGGAKSEQVELVTAPTPEPVTPALSVVPADTHAEDIERLDALNRLAGELADQRVHLVEQYQRLAEIQELWSVQREQAADELEAAAQKLHELEQTLNQRERDAVETEQNLHQEREALQTVRQEIQVWRSRLQAREQATEQEYEQRLTSLRQQETLLQGQLDGLAQLRQRWNRRRREEIDYVRTEQGQVRQQREEAQQLRHELFEKAQRLEEEKRIVAEKALTVELYLQEVARKSNDPAAERRLERLRRRWLMQNTVLIRDARHEREAVKIELAQLSTRYHEWLKQMEAVTQADAILAEKLTELEEREASLKAHERLLNLENSRHDMLRHEAEQRLHLMKEEIERMASVVYEEEANTLPWPANKAA